MASSAVRLSSPDTLVFRMIGFHRSDRISLLKTMRSGSVVALNPAFSFVFDEATDTNSEDNAVSIPVQSEYELFEVRLSFYQEPQAFLWSVSSSC